MYSHIINWTSLCFNQERSFVGIWLVDIVYMICMLEDLWCAFGNFYHVGIAFYGQIGKSCTLSLVANLGTQPLEVKCFENPPRAPLSYSLRVEPQGSCVNKIYGSMCGVRHFGGKGGGTKVGGSMHEFMLWFWPFRLVEFTCMTDVPIPMQNLQTFNN